MRYLGTSTIGLAQHRLGFDARPPLTTSDRGLFGVLAMVGVVGMLW